MPETNLAAGAVARTKLILQVADMAGKYTPDALHASKVEYFNAMKLTAMPRGELSDQLWSLHQQCWKGVLDEAYARQRLERLSSASQRRRQRVANLSQIEQDRQNQQRNRTILSILSPSTILVNALNTMVRTVFAKKGRPSEGGLCKPNHSWAYSAS